MQYGFVVDLPDIRTIGDLSEEAEEAGWDGLFVADALAIETKGFPIFPLFDPWVVLAVIATRTSRMRIGTMISAVPRRRPWKMAREALTLDHLSNGRLILGVGLGAANDDGGFYKVGEAMDLKVRAKRLDEGLAIMAGLWSGKPFSYDGEHFKVDAMTMIPGPLQTPRIPIWVPGVCGKTNSLRRALAWDGIIPQKYKSMARLKPDEIKELNQFISENREQTTPFDIISGGETPGSDKKRAVAKVRPFSKAGATWWIESLMTFSADDLRTRVKQGPPRSD